MTPDGEIGRQAYLVIREAMRKEGMVALGRVILTTREHVIAIEPHGQGLLGITLRYPYEIRKEADYFGDLQDERVPKEMLDLATHIVATRSGHFRPEKFEDRYERALRELIKRKQRGEQIVKPRERPSAKVIDLMEALRQTAAARRGPARKHPQQASAEDKRGRARRTNAQARKAS
jgi:DNA end-binding protein Ku